jgi:hypothetical protein
VSLPLNKYRKVAVDFCSDPGEMKEQSLSSVTEEQRRAGQKDQDLVCNGFSGNDTIAIIPILPLCFTEARVGYFFRFDVIGAMTTVLRYLFISSGEMITQGLVFLIYFYNNITLRVWNCHYYPLLSCQSAFYTLAVACFVYRTRIAPDSQGFHHLGFWIRRPPIY